MEIIRPSTVLKPVLMPWARLMLGFAPVARMPQPSSVPKNQYIMAISTTVMIPTITSGLRRANSFTQRREMSTPFLSTLMDWLALPMIFRLMEYSESWVKIPARMAGMPINVWNRPVTRPVSRPATSAINRANHTLWPLSSSMMHTAPPVPIEPSTVRSATSRMR